MDYHRYDEDLEYTFEPVILDSLTHMAVPVIQRSGNLPTQFLKQPAPNIIAQSGDNKLTRFVEFFTARIRNKNTRMAYAQAVNRFLRWCDVKGLGLEDLGPIVVA